MMGGFLDRSRFVARPGWSRWLVPPAALSIQLAIGSAYAWSVFKIPLESLPDDDLLARDAVAHKQAEKQR